MENANSPEYLEKIKNQLVDNLRRTAHVPSVQMQDVPRHSLGAMSDEDDAELDDLDEDENKDVRMTQRQWDQRIERDNEYEESDNEDLDRANGVAHRNGSARPAFMDYRNSDVEGDSGVVTPANGSADHIIKSKETDEVVMEDAEDKDQKVEMETDLAAKADEEELEPEVEASAVAEREKSPKEAQESTNSEKEGDDSDKTAVADNDGAADNPETTKERDEVMQDVTDEEEEKKEKAPEAEAPKAKSTEPEEKAVAQPTKTDEDGDVNMDEPAAEPAEEEKATTVKKEEATETAAVTETAEAAKEGDKA